MAKLTRFAKEVKAGLKTGLTLGKAIQQAHQVAYPSPLRMVTLCKHCGMIHIMPRTINE